MSPVSIALIVIFLALLWSILHYNKRREKLPPGPWPFPIIGNLHMLGQLPHRSFQQLARSYGPIMSLKLGAVPAIVVSSPQAAELFLKQRDVDFAARSAPEVATHLFYKSKSIGFSPYGDYWRQVRKMCTLELLTTRKVESFEGLRRSEIEGMVLKLRDVADAGEAVDMEKLVQNLVQDITFKMVVGKRCDEKHDLKYVVDKTMELAGSFNLADFLPFFSFLDLQGLTKQMKHLHKRIDDILEDMINDHLIEGDCEEYHDILSNILALTGNPSDEDTALTFGRDNVKAIMLDLFMATIDTVPTATVWSLSALLKHPRVMKLLHEELNDIVGKSRMVQESDLSKLSYLDMVVKESLRLYPLGLLPRECINDVVINGYAIPKNARVFINFWAIARDPNVWSQSAAEFQPERFANKDVDMRGQNFEYFPFGYGRRGCAGMEMGLVMFKIILAQLVHCFDWMLPGEMQPEEVDMTEKFGLAIKKANKLFAIPSFRLQTNL